MSEKATAAKSEIVDQSERVDETAPTDIEPEDKWLVSLYLSTSIIKFIYDIKSFTSKYIIIIAYSRVIKLDN